MIRACIGALVASVVGSAAVGCSIDTACAVGGRDYYIARPDSSSPPPAVMFIHGFGGSGRGALRNTAMVDAFLARGFAVIAPDGQPREGRTGRSWNFHPRSGGQEAEIDHLEAVRDDAIVRHGLDGDRIMLAGFSIGGSMVAYTACLRPEAFSAYAPLGGSFWRPHPDSCAGPVRMLHVHGWTDGTVPIEGRVVNRLPLSDPDAFAQGDVFRAMDIFRQANGCDYANPDRREVSNDYWLRIWDQCREGSDLRLAVFARGHVIPQTWPKLVADWYEGL